MKFAIQIGLIAGLIACADPVDRQIQIVLAGGEGREEAKLELLLAKTNAVPKITAILQDQSQPFQARLDMVELLWKIYLRESVVGIPQSLINHLGDPVPEIRCAAAAALGNFNLHAAVDPLIAQLEGETDERASYAALASIAKLDGWRLGNITGGQTRRIVAQGGEKLDPVLRTRFLNRVTVLYASARSDSLRDTAEEILELAAGQLAQEGQRLVLKADLENARLSYEAAYALKSDSRNTARALGKFLYFHVDPDSGLAFLDRVGMVTRVSLADQMPILDGEFDERLWAGAAKIDSFWQNLNILRVLPSIGRTQALVARTQTHLLVGVKGFEDDTSDLWATQAERDGEVWRDDSVEIFLDTNLDQRDFFQVVTNSIGTVWDVKNSVVRSEQDNEWNATIQVGTRLATDHWAAEVAIPFADMEVAPQAGDAWGFNLSRMRMSRDSEQMLWMPTYGNSQRPGKFGILLFE